MRRGPFIFEKAVRSVPLPAFVLLALLLALSAPALAEEDGGGGGGGGGGAAGAILNGIADNIKAAAPAVIAGIQAVADEKIAKINAAANVEMTQITADTAKFLADRQTEIALYQAYTAKEINQINQEGQTRRLEDQLAELRAARQDALQADRMKTYYEALLNQEQIALAYKQSADNFRLAQMTLQSNLVKAGLSSGFTNVDSGSRLTVSRVLAGGKIASSYSPGTTLASALGKPSAVKTRGIVATKKPAAIATKPPATLSRLMASLQKPSFTSVKSPVGRFGKRGFLARGLRGPVPYSLGARLARVLSGGIASGSFPELHHKQQIPAVPLSDLASFHAAVQSEAGSSVPGALVAEGGEPPSGAGTRAGTSGHAPVALPPAGGHAGAAFNAGSFLESSPQVRRIGR